MIRALTQGTDGWRFGTTCKTRPSDSRGQVVLQGTFVSAISDHCLSLSGCSFLPCCFRVLALTTFIASTLALRNACSVISGKGLPLRVGCGIAELPSVQGNLSPRQYESAPRCPDSCFVNGRVARVCVCVCVCVCVRRVREGVRVHALSVFRLSH